VPNILCRRRRRLIGQLLLLLLLPLLWNLPFFFSLVSLLLSIYIRFRLLAMIPA